MKAREWQWNEIPDHFKTQMLEITKQHHMSLDQLKKYQVSDLPPVYRVPEDNLREQGGLLCDMNGTLTYFPTTLTKPMETYDQSCPVIQVGDIKRPAPMVAHFHVHPYGVIPSNRDMINFARGEYPIMDEQYSCIGNGLGKKKYVLCLERTETTKSLQNHIQNLVESLPDGFGSHYPFDELDDKVYTDAHSVETVDYRGAVHSFDTYSDTTSKIIKDAHDKYIKDTNLFKIHYIEEK